MRLRLAIALAGGALALGSCAYDTYGYGGYGGYGGASLGYYSGYGFAIQGEKKLHPRLTVSGGFARIDKPMFNGDRFAPGKRFFASGTLKLSREFSLNSMIIHGVGDLPTGSTPRTRLDVMITYNVLETFHRFKIF